VGYFLFWGVGVFVWGFNFEGADSPLFEDFWQSSSKVHPLSV